MVTPVLKMLIQLTQSGVSGDPGESRDDLILNTPVKVDLPDASFNLDEYGFLWQWDLTDHILPVMCLRSISIYLI